MHDVRHALRAFAKDPRFAGVAVVTLALGIGANTAIFSVVHAVLLRPLAYAQADRLVRLYENVPIDEPPAGRVRRLGGMNVRELLELRARSRTLSHVVSNSFAMVTAVGRDEAVRLFGTPVSVDAFPMLGMQPALGRWFTPADSASGSAHVIMLSDIAWRRCFGGDPNVVGQTLTFTGRAPGGLGGDVPLNVPFTVVGVMPPTFHFPGDNVQFWTPMALTAPADGRPRRTTMMARLADGATIDAAVAEVGAVLQDVRGVSAPFGPRRFELVRVQDELTQPVRPALVVLTVAVGFVLLVACANVANLLLARAAARRRELAIRAALGATRARLMQLALTESVILAAAGGVAGIALAFGGVRLFHVLGTNLPRMDLVTRSTFPRLDEVAVDVPALMFALGVSVATGVVCGLVPAFGRSHSRQVDDLRSMTSAASGFAFGRRHAEQGILVFAQIALATLLCVGGGLLIRSFLQLASVNPGYDPSQVLTFQIAAPGERGTVPQILSFSDSIVSRMKAIPGVQAAGYANQLPMVGLRDTAGGLWTTPDPARQPPAIGPDARFVSADYLKAMGIRVIAGRGFDANDDAGHPRVVLINQALARSQFAGEDPIGRTVYIFRGLDPWQIVGIVDDVHQFALDRAPEPQFFVDVRQWPVTGPPLFPGGAYYALRTATDPVSVVAAVRDAVHQVDARAAPDNIAPMDRIVSNSMTEPRLYTVLLGLLAIVAAALATIGIYGVVAYAVAQRTREIGIRVALGAMRQDVIGLVLRQSIALTAAGIVAGLVAAAGAGRFLQGMLFGLTPLDFSTFAVVALAFAVVAALASYVPARRATNVDPLVALRCE